MRPEERRKQIEAYLQKVEFASLEELAHHVGASRSTIRRDLALLEAAGLIRRTYGGARILNPKSDEFAFVARDGRQVAEKEAIAKQVVKLLQPGQTILVDAGTTTYHVARYLEPLRPQIITNSLPVATLFAGTPTVEMVVTGGVLYPRLGVLLGPLTVEALKHMHADVAVMGAGGITEEGITNSHSLLIDVQRAMMKAAEKVIFCLDHTKLGKSSIAYLCDLAEVDLLVTDSKADPSIVERLRKKGLEVLLAPLSEEAPLPSS